MGSLSKVSIAASNILTNPWFTERSKSETSSFAPPWLNLIDRNLLPTLLLGGHSHAATAFTTSATGHCVLGMLVQGPWGTATNHSQLCLRGTTTNASRLACA